MIRNIWTVLCEHVLTEAGTNRHSYIQVIEQGVFHEFPVNLPTFSIATFWEKTSEEEATITIRLSFNKPSGKNDEILTTESFKISKKTQHIDLINPPGFKAESPGRHSILVEYSENNQDWKTASEIPIEIKKPKKSQNG